tara:strand:+ start:181 stop:681 length:501 start_codon:yes stop_codon:yes gene_type:complete
MNDFGTLATTIINFEFSEDSCRFPNSYVSGWLEANLGELNGHLHEEFSINDSGNIAPYPLEPVEEVIFTKLYEIHFYEKATRDVLRGLTSNSSLDWVYLKEADTTIQRVNKNSVAKTLQDAAKEARKCLRDLVYQYNSLKSAPLQVYGADSLPVSSSNSSNDFLRL